MKKLNRKTKLVLYIIGCFILFVLYIMCIIYISLAIFIIAIIACPVFFKTLNLLKPDNRYSNGFLAMLIPLLMIVSVYCASKIKTNYYLQKSSKITYGIVTYIGVGGRGRGVPINYIYNVDKQLKIGAENISASLFKKRRFHVNDTILVQYSETKDGIYAQVYKFNPTNEALQQYIQDKDYDLLKEYKKPNPNQRKRVIIGYTIIILIIVAIVICGLLADKKKHNLYEDYKNNGR